MGQPAQHTQKMTKKEYNGWFNYETWVVNLWLNKNDTGGLEEMVQEIYDNAKPSYKWETKEDAARYDLAQTLKDMHEGVLPEVQGFAADLLNAAMSEVNWDEIAGHYLDAVEKDAEVES